MKTLLPAGLKKVSSRADRSYDLTFSTRELGGEEAAFLLDQIHNEGWLLWALNESDVSETDIPDEKADSMTGQKTQSQRLRACIYILWQQRKKSTKTFEAFYSHFMEQLINQVKDKLEGDSQ